MNEPDLTDPHFILALDLYHPPFRFDHGFIWDADNNMVADRPGQDSILRIRGWGQISYKPNPEQLQDAIGHLIAQALTDFWIKFKKLTVVEVMDDHVHIADQSCSVCGDKG
jgi:hypothetical protein